MGSTAAVEGLLITAVAVRPTYGLKLTICSTGLLLLVAAVLMGPQTKLAAMAAAKQGKAGQIHTVQVDLEERKRAFPILLGKPIHHLKIPPPRQAHTPDLDLAATVFLSRVVTPGPEAVAGMAVLVLCPIARVTMTVAAVEVPVLCGLAAQFQRGLP